MKSNKGKLVPKLIIATKTVGGKSFLLNFSGLVPANRGKKPEFTHFDGKGKRNIYKNSFETADEKIRNNYVHIAQLN